jgi:hypothetical protein
VVAWAIAEDLLRLAGHALVLVGTRDLPAPDGQTTLVTRLQPAGAEVVRLLEEVDDARDYVIRRLADVDVPQLAAGQVAEAMLAAHRGEDEGLFLLARVITAQLHADPVDTARPGWQQRLAGSVADAFDRDLKGLPARRRGEEELPAAGLDLLAGLAWAHGGGLPADIWPVVAAALSREDAVAAYRELALK